MLLLDSQTDGIGVKYRTQGQYERSNFVQMSPETDERASVQKCIQTAQ